MAEPAGQIAAPARRHVWRIVGAVLILAIAAVIVRQLVQSWPAVRAYPWRWRWSYMIASLAMMQLSYLISARSWRSVLRAIKVRLRFTTAYWIFFISNLGRYLPGKLWQMTAAAMFGRELGLSGRDMVASLVVNQLYVMPMGAVLALSWGELPTPYNDVRTQTIAWVLALAALVAAVWPHLVLSALGPLTRKLGIEPERWRLELSRRIGIVVQCAATWICMTIGFTLFVMAITPVGFEHVADLSRAYVASYLLGYLVLIAPGGLGVREGTITVLLAPMFGAGPAAGIALLSRIWVTISELIAITPALFWARRDRSKSELTQRPRPEP